MQRDARYIADIIEAAELISKFLTSKGQADFDSDKLLHNGVLRLLIVVGEAVTQLSPGFRDAHPEIPWRPISNFRHRLVHDYSGIDMRIAWEVAAVHVPALHSQLTQILAAEFTEDDN